MFKKIFLIVILQLFAHCCGKSIYRDESNDQLTQEPINPHLYYREQYGGALKDLEMYMQKLHNQGLIQPINQYKERYIPANDPNGYAYPWYPSYQPVYSNTQQDHEKVTKDDKDIPNIDATNLPFDELAVIQLIPIIISQLKRNDVTISEKHSLEAIFGDSLWSLIQAEAIRNHNSDMNPLLKTILNSEEVKLSRRDITGHFGNDIYKNSLRRVYRGSSSHFKSKSAKPYISLDDDKKLLSPSERLLNMVAAIVHKSNVMEKSRQKAEREAKIKHKEKLLRKRNKKSASSGNPLGIIKPRQRYVDRLLSFNRMKRSIIKFGTDLNDMRTLLEQVNHDNDLLNDDEKHLVDAVTTFSSFIDNDDDDDDDDNDEDEYMDDDFDYDFSNDHQHNQLSSEGDYKFDMYPRRRNIFDDYENGSVNEFISLSRQRDRREKNFIDDMQDDEEYDEDDFEVYDDI